MELQIVLSKDLSDAPPFILSRAVISDRGFGVSFLTDAMRTPLHTELQVHLWLRAIAEQSSWERKRPWPPAPAAALAVPRAFSCSWTEGTEKGAGGGTVQRASVEGGGSPGSLSFARLFRSS